MKRTELLRAWGGPTPGPERPATRVQLCSQVTSQAVIAITARCEAGLNWESADRHQSDMIALIVGMSGILKSKIVAEGIKSTLQLRQLESLGCELGQEYLFSHPLDAKSVESWLKAGIKTSAVAR